MLACPEEYRSFQCRAEDHAEDRRCSQYYFEQKQSQV